MAGFPSIPAPVVDEAGHPIRARLWTSVGLQVHLGVALALGTLALLTYANSFSAEFALDSKFLLLEDRRIQEASRENVKLIFSEDYWWPKSSSGLYRPVTTLSYLLNYSVFGNATSPVAYHWVNLLLHWGNAMLAYLVVLMLMGNPWPAFFVAAIFSVHPVTTEAVTNITGRADLLATASVLGGLLLYARSGVTPGWRKIPWLVGLAAATLVGLFSKESAVVVVGLIVVYDLVFRLELNHQNRILSLIQNLWRFIWKGYLALVPPVLVWIAVRREVFGGLRLPEGTWQDNPLLMGGVDIWEQKMTAIKVIGKYLWLLAWPARLSPDYSFNQVPVVDLGFQRWEDWKAILALVAVSVGLLVALRQCRRNRVLTFFILLFFIGLVPVSNLIFPLGNIMAERFLYLPLIGFAGCLVLTVYTVCRRLVLRLDLSAWIVPLWLQVAARSLLIMIILAYGARAFARNFDWQDDIELWTAAVKASPDSYNAHKSLAFALYESNPTRDNEHLDQIIVEGEKALEITDQTQIVLLHLGAYYRLKGDKLAQQTPDGSLISTPQSRKWYQESVKALRAAIPLDEAHNQQHFEKERARGLAPREIMDVGNHEIYWNLGLSEMRLGRHEEAIEAYQLMRHLAPGNPDAYLSIASAHLARGQLEPATIALVQSLLLDSSRRQTMRLLVDLYRQIDREGCAVAFAAGEAKLNVDCALVRTHMCIAYAGLVEVLAKAKQFQVAEETRNTAVQKYRCNPAVFDELIPPPQVTIGLAP